MESKKKGKKNKKYHKLRDGIRQGRSAVVDLSKEEAPELPDVGEAPQLSAMVDLSSLQRKNVGELLERSAQQNSKSEKKGTSGLLKQKKHPSNIPPHELNAIGELAYYLARMKKHENTSEGLKVSAVAEEEEEGGGQGDDTQLEEEQLELRSASSSREDELVGHEFSSNAGRADFVVFAFDNDYTTRERLNRFNPEALCAFLIIDPKGYGLEKVWKHGPGGVYQTAAYAVTHGLENLKKGRKKPIVLQGWSKDRWTYGEFLVHGVVHVSDERIVEDASLQSLFDKRQNDLKEYMEDATTTYKPGKYLSGSLYISDEILDFPTPVRVQSPTHESARFVEAILRICLGERVLHFTEKDAEELFAAVRAGSLESAELNTLTSEAYERFRLTKRMCR